MGTTFGSEVNCPSLGSGTHLVIPEMAQNLIRNDHSSHPHRNSTATP